jgi:hypothetical protein
MVSMNMPVHVSDVMVIRVSFIPTVIKDFVETVDKSSTLLTHSKGVVLFDLLRWLH